MVVDFLVLPNDTILEDWFIENAQGQFPENGKIDYVANYAATIKSINTEANEIGKNITKDSGQIYLNDHGENHIKMVVQRASRLIFETRFNITIWEAYILLLSIYFHDLGILYAREGHERNVQQKIKELMIGHDTPTLRYIAQIAFAHGGEVEENKDKIGELRDCHLFGHEIRLQALAAILKLADELSDDYMRASPLLGGDESMFGKSLIFHVYSHSLRDVIIKNGIIDLRYEFDKKTAQRQFEKPSSNNTYLIDEIYSRLTKMHYERLYCMRFLYRYIAVPLDLINFKIEVYDYETELISSPLKIIPGQLREQGYPSDTLAIREICSSDALITGEELKSLL